MKFMERFMNHSPRQFFFLGIKTIKNIKYIAHMHPAPLLTCHNPPHGIYKIEYETGQILLRQPHCFYLLPRMFRAYSYFFA